MPSLSTNPAQSNRLFSNTFNLAGLLPFARASRFELLFTGRLAAGFEVSCVGFEALSSVFRYAFASAESRATSFSSLVHQ